VPVTPVRWCFDRGVVACSATTAAARHSSRGHGVVARVRISSAGGHADGTAAAARVSAHPTGRAVHGDVAQLCARAEDELMAEATTLHRDDTRTTRTTVGLHSTGTTAARMDAGVGRLMSGSASRRRSDDRAGAHDSCADAGPLEQSPSGDTDVGGFWVTHDRDLRVLRLVLPAPVLQHRRLPPWHRRRTATLQRRRRCEACSLHTLGRR
jgi:hypothetical protein